MNDIVIYKYNNLFTSTWLKKKSVEQFPFCQKVCFGQTSERKMHVKENLSKVLNHIIFAPFLVPFSHCRTDK